MGCSCCRMIKSHIYDPSVSVDAAGQKKDAGTSSLYQNKALDGSCNYRVHGFHNFGYSTKTAESLKRGACKFEIDNNEINRLHANPSHPEPGHAEQSVAEPRSLYIMEVENKLQNPAEASYAEPGDRLLLDSEAKSDGVTQDKDRNSPHVSSQGKDWEGNPDGRWPSGLQFAGKMDGSHASTASFSTTETRLSHLEEDDGIAPASLAAEETGDGDESCNVLDSDVAEALAALEAATADED